MDEFLEKFQTAFGDTLSIAMIDICASNISSISRKICNIWNFICFGFTNWRCADSDDHDQDCPRCYCSGGRTCTSQRQVELMMLAPPFGSIALASTERCPPQNNVNLSRINLISFLQASWYAHNWPMAMASGHAITTPKPPSHIYELCIL